MKIILPQRTLSSDTEFTEENKILVIASGKESKEPTEQTLWAPSSSSVSELSVLCGKKGFLD
jgi:hypothetical protein